MVCDSISFRKFALQYTFKYKLHRRFTMIITSCKDERRKFTVVLNEYVTKYAKDYQILNPSLRCSYSDFPN